MTDRTVRLDDVQEWTLAALLNQVARSHQAIRVVMEDGKTVEIRPLDTLEPLPELEGFVPDGWKDAIYAR
ncbi:MAG TPA: hypothetical protein VFJ58_16150 [Armatimonadota bacterium]|nr:hypothetical protein [Armatimonadota bacterium]